MFLNYEAKHMDGVIKLWNKAAVKDGYKELNEESFIEIFLSNPYFKTENTFVLIDDEVCGFACGCTGLDLPLGETSGYITCIILSPEKQNSANFKEMLSLLENSFIKQGKKQSEILFFNPIMLPWYIPDTPKHEHNNAPGAFVNSWYHKELLLQGYFERTRECAMYLNLSGFEIPQEIKVKELAAQEKGYEVCLFDINRHSGVAEMLKDLGNPLWEKEIEHCTSNNIPVVVAANDNKTVGFAGPVIRQKSGRGYFTGIGVHPQHEGKGLGNILFFKLCEAFGEIGAEYMSLYTGAENPAIKIYKKAGFVTVKEFAVMRKVLA